MSDLAKELPTYYIIKFFNGEEIVCDLNHIDEEQVKLINPMKIHAYPKMTETGQVKEQIALHRWLHPYTNETEFTVGKKNIMTIAKCSDTMMIYYENFLFKKDDDNLTHKEVELKNQEKKHTREYVTVKTEDDVH
jgi:hypothetical protein|tara:strand:- start:2662 stop:3066 length:405 start_codon:yes stop_codon:yes gene_type:complete